MLKLFRLRLFNFDVQVLVWSNLFALDEVGCCFDQADFVVQRRRPHNYWVLLRRRILFLRSHRKTGAGDNSVFILFLETDAFYEIRRRVLHDDELMCYDSVDDLLLLGLGHVEHARCLVQLVLAA